MTPYTLCLLVLLAIAVSIQGHGQEQKIDVMYKQLTAGHLELKREEKNDFNHFGKGSDCRLTECPKDWVAHGSSCYVLGNDYVSWAQAQEFCKAYGGHLAEIETAEENDFVKAFLQNFTSPRVRFAWLGGTDMFNDHNWVWASTGLLFDYQNFQPMQGKEIGGKCLLAARSQDYMWKDEPCHLRNSFVCEARPVNILL